MRRDLLFLCLTALPLVVNCGDDTVEEDATTGRTTASNGAPASSGAGAQGGGSDEGGGGSSAFSCDACDELATCDEAAETCTCPTGYSDPNGDGSLCSNLDECAKRGHDCDPDVGICTDNEGSFSCACPATGYDDVNGDGTLCTNIDECTAGTDDCDAIVGECTDTEGSFTCACPSEAAEGYVDVNGDGTLCEQYDIFGISPFQDWIFQHDGDTLASVGCMQVTDSGGASITGVTGMTKHPTTGVVWAVAKVSAVSGRVLGTFDLPTAVFTAVGNLGDNFSSIHFSNDGTILYGVTGNGASVPETLYTINTGDASKTVVQALGNGADGEVIATAGDGTMYHWSGNGTVVFESVSLGNTTTDIPITGTPGGETFGAVWWSWHKDVNGDPDPAFLVANISSSFTAFHTDGTVEPTGATTFDDLRGLVFALPAGYTENLVCDPTP
jgi:hypothetical protein